MLARPRERCLPDCEHKAEAFALIVLGYLRIARDTTVSREIHRTGVSGGCERLRPEDGLARGPHVPARRLCRSRPRAGGRRDAFQPRVGRGVRGGRGTRLRSRARRVSGYRGSSLHPLLTVAPGAGGGRGPALVGSGGHLCGDVHQRDRYDDRQRRAAGHVERPRRGDRRVAVGARRVPCLARRSAARRQWARRSVRAPAGVSGRADRLRGHVRACGRGADGGRADRRARADGSGRGVCDASGAVAAGRALPARAAGQGGGDLVRGRGARAGARTGRGRCARRCRGLALGVSRQRPVRAARGFLRAALAAGVAPAGGAAARLAGCGALDAGAGGHRVRAHRGRRRRMDEPGRARGRGDGHRRRRRVRGHRAPPTRAALRRARTRTPARRGGRCL